MIAATKKPHEEWLDVDEAAKYLGISRTSLFRLRHSGKLKPVNDNPLLDRPRALYFEKEELDRLRREAQANQGG